MADEPKDGPAPEKAAPERDTTTNEGAGTSPAAAPAKAAAAPPATAAPAASAPAAPAAKPAPAAAAAPKPAAAKAGDGDLTRRGFFSWAAVAWVGFSAAIGGCVTVMGRFMFPNVLFEPPTSFKAG
ncbi:MAG TPA: hypothetical protein VGK45_15475, partial [Thermoanaerobaculia bacterium]